MQDPKDGAGHSVWELAVSPSTEDDARDASPKSLRRIFSFLQLLFLSVAYMGGWESPLGNLYPAFLNGGPQVLFWGTVVVWIGAMAQSASLAEMSSILPIAGAQYHWTAALAPTKFRKIITYIQGWLTWLAWLALVASIISVTVNLIEGTVMLHDPSRTFEPWQTFLMMMGILVVLYIINVFFFWIVPWLEFVCGVFHVVMFFVYIGVLAGLAKDKHSANFVFFSRVDSKSTSGWDNGFVSWHLGLLTPIWGFCGFDAAVHLSEETKRAKLVVPRVIFWSIASNGIFSLSMIVTTLFCAGNVLDVALNSPFPFGTIALQATGSLTGATWMAAGLIFSGLSGSLSSLVSVSRLTWAWSRDGGFGSHVSPFLATVSSRRRIPERAVAVSAIATLVISLPNLGSTIVFAALTSLSTLALYLSYLIAIACMLLNRYGIGSRPAMLGAWNLGKWGPAINVFALVYSTYMAFWIPWPSARPTTAENMNWAGPITGAVLAIVLLLYPVTRRQWRGVDEMVVGRVVKES